LNSAISFFIAEFSHTRPWPSWDSTQASTSARRLKLRATILREPLRKTLLSPRLLALRVYRGELVAAGKRPAILGAGFQCRCSSVRRSWSSEHEHVDDLAVLVDRAVNVPPVARDFDVGLIDEPAPPYDMAARSCRVDQQRRETLHPPKQGDVIDVDAALSEELLEIAVRQSEAEIPADCQHDHLGREPETPRTLTARRKTLADDDVVSPRNPRRRHAIRQRNSASARQYADAGMLRRS
jgi:hypothetical protein